MKKQKIKEYRRKFRKLKGYQKYTPSKTNNF
jgi:hypothetical protein